MMAPLALNGLIEDDEIAILDSPESNRDQPKYLCTVRANFQHLFAQKSWIFWSML